LKNNPQIKSLKQNMKHLLIIPALALVVGCNDKKNTEVAVNLEDENTKLSYSLGVVYGNDIISSKDQLEFLQDSIFIQGIKDALASKTKVDLQTAQSNLDAHFMQKRESKVNENVEASKVFFETNAKREGVIQIESGLQYEILKEAKGNKPVATDKVKVHYHGTLLDGTVFDSSVDRGEPVTFGVTEVIPGWTEILQLMPVGSKWKVFIPYNLAYGSQGAGPIQPYSTLIFEIELLDIVK
jgi:FKBP-type peptidyl-prolyl cis-trans isomerase